MKQEISGEATIKDIKIKHYTKKVANIKTRISRYVAQYCQKNLYSLTRTHLQH